MFDKSFFLQEGKEVAIQLLGKLLCIKQIDGSILKQRITETELYSGYSDSASHAYKGKTNRNEIMYEEGGCLYIYLCYGIHHLLNIVTNVKNYPEAILIRATSDYNGPGKLTKALGITLELNKCSMINNPNIWLEDDGFQVNYKCEKRIGISYASKEDQERLWHYVLDI